MTKKEKRSTAGRILWGCFFFLLLLVLVSLGLAWWLADRILQQQPLDPPPLRFNAYDIHTARKKLEPLPQAIMQSHPEDVIELALTPGEVNAILGFARLSSNFAGSFGKSNISWPDGLEIQFVDDYILTTYTYPLPRSTPFGQHFNAVMQLQPQLHGGNGDYRIDELKFGRLNIPPVLMRFLLRGYGSDTAESLEMLKRTVIDLYVDSNHHLRLKLSPFQIRQLLVNRLKTPQLPPRQPQAPQIPIVTPPPDPQEPQVAPPPGPGEPRPTPAPLSEPQPTPKPAIPEPQVKTR